MAGSRRISRAPMVTVPSYLAAVESLHGIGTREIARGLGVSVSVVRRWRRGELVPTVRRVKKMVALWGGDADLLALGAAMQRYARETGLSLDEAVKLVRSGRRTAPERKRQRPLVDRNQLSLPIA